MSIILHKLKDYRRIYFLARLCFDVLNKKLALGLLWHFPQNVGGIFFHGCASNYAIADRLVQLLTFQFREMFLKAKSIKFKHDARFIYLKENYTF